MEKKYIDSEKLIAEIERLKERAQAERVLHPKTILAAKDYLLIQDYDNLLSFIDSLQQEQEQYVIGGQVFGATDVEQLYEGKVYIISNLVQDTEFGIEPREKVEMLLIKD